MKLTVAIIGSGEKLDKFLLDSISFADEIVVIQDSSKKGQTTSTGKIKHYHRPLDGDFAAQRNFALEKAASDWVLFVDSDEYVGKELAREIKEKINSDEYDGYLIRRIDVVFHQRLLHGETGNTRMLRLGRKDTGKFVRPVHEVWKIKGRVGELLSPLYHIKDNFISQFTGRMSAYSQIDSQVLTKEGKPFSYFRLLFYPKAKFYLNYFFKAGFMDGLAGFFQAYLMSVQSLTVRIFQWEKRN